MYAVRHLPITTITHNFLITGHTQNHADNIHSVIERKKKRILKCGPMYTPAQMTMALKSAKKTGKSYSGHAMDTDSDPQNIESIDTYSISSIASKVSIPV